MKKITHLILHHSAVSKKDLSYQFDIIKKNHIAKGWGDIGYNYFVETNGILFKGRSEVIAGAHTIGYNENSIGICVAGNYNIDKLSPKQFKTLKGIIDLMRKKYDIPFENVIGHYKVSQTACPGKNIKKIMKKLMFMKELKRDKDGGFWFIKQDDNGKQKIDTSLKAVGGIVTILSREFGVEQISSKELDVLEDKIYF